jgi:p-cumate 2,3-dioxygenase subunit alpha
VENSLDGYHLLPVHTTYFEYLEKVEGRRPNFASLDEGVDLGNGHAAIKTR